MIYSEQNCIFIQIPNARNIIYQSPSQQLMCPSL